MTRTEALNLFNSAFSQFRGAFVDQVDADKLVEAAIGGLLTSLDPHSKYLNPDKYAENKAQNSGEFGGVGVEMAVENGLVKVLTPIEDSPAFRAGVLPGDFFTHINGEPVRGVTLVEAMERMRGSIGTPLKLTVQRGKGGQSFDLTLMRELVKSPAVRWRTEGTVGYVKISGFTQQTQPGLEKAMAGIDAELGPRLTGYVLDLRDNPGGLVKQAISVCDSFLDQGEIVSTRGRDPDVGAALLRHAGRSGPWQADRADRQRPQRIGIGDRGRRSPGPAPGGGAGHPDLRQGLRPDHHAAVQPGRHADDDGALLYADRPLHPGAGHQPRRGGRAGQGDAGGRPRAGRRLPAYPSAGHRARCRRVHSAGFSLRPAGANWFSNRNAHGLRRPRRSPAGGRAACLRRSRRPAGSGSSGKPG